MSRTLDMDGNGYLDLKEWMLANDLVTAATVEQKLSFAFNVSATLPHPTPHPTTLLFKCTLGDFFYFFYYLG